MAKIIINTDKYRRELNWALSYGYPTTNQLTRSYSGSERRSQPGLIHQHHVYLWVNAGLFVYVHKLY